VVQSSVAVVFGGGKEFFKSCYLHLTRHCQLHVRLVIMCGDIATVSGVPAGCDFVAAVCCNAVMQGSSMRGPWSPLPWPAGRFEKITTNASPARCLHII
jgi:hypothetical protein